MILTSPTPSDLRQFLRAYNDPGFQELLAFLKLEAKAQDKALREASSQDEMLRRQGAANLAYGLVDLIEGSRSSLERVYAANAKPDNSRHF